jgi:phospholipid/cholesterol/gamma-HCH transport system substrate-binding protein
MVLRFSSRAAQIFSPAQMPIHFISPRADGLSQGSPINYLGISIGRVTAVSRRPDGQSILIDGTVDRSPPLPANIRAAIMQSSAIGGGSSVSLDLEGQQAEGTLQSGATLNARYLGLSLQFLPPQFTQAAEDVGKMSQEISKTTEDLHKSGAIQHLDEALKRATQVLDSMQALLGEEKTQQNIRVAIANIRQTTEATTRLSVKLETLTDSLQHDSSDLTKQMGDRLTQLASVLNTLQSISQKLDSGKGTAGMLVNDPRLYESLADTTRQLNATVSDLRRLLEQWEQEGVTMKLK